MGAESGDALGTRLRKRMCECEPMARRQEVEGGLVMLVCPACGTKTIDATQSPPEWIRDGQSYLVTVLLTPAVLKQHINLLKEESGVSTPMLMAMAKEARTLVLKNGRASGFHYKLRDYWKAGLPVEVEPAYPHYPELY